MNITSPTVAAPPPSPTCPSAGVPSSGPTQATQPDRAAAGAIVALSLCMLLSALGISIANVGLPAIAQAFGVSFQAVQWVVIAYLLALTALMVGVGRLGDALGRRRLLCGGVALFTGAAAAGALAPTLWALVVARALQGAGAAAMMVLTLAMVADAVPRAKAGAAMGWLGSVSAVGTALGPALGGLLIEASGWRALFLATLPLGAVAIALLRRFLPVDATRRSVARAPMNLPGIALLAWTLGAVALALTPSASGPGLGHAALLMAAGLGLLLFLRCEARAEAPLLDASLWREQGLRSGLAMNALVSMVMMATLVVGPFHLARSLALAPAFVGLVLATGPAVAALSGLPAGRMVDRLGAPRVMRVGLGAVVTGCVLLAAHPLSLGVAGYVLPLALLTAGYALFQAANNTAVMRDVEAGRRGVVSGVLGLSRNLGFIGGAAAMGTLYAWGERLAVGGGLRVTFLAGAGMGALALGIGWCASARASRPRRLTPPRP